MASDTRKTVHRRTVSIPTTSSNLLNGKGFLIEVDNRREFERVATAIRRFGGQILDTYMEEKLPIVVISDHCLATKIEHKRLDIENPNEKLLKAMPALLREAVKRKIRIRTVNSFMKQLADWAQKSRKPSSATNSTRVILRQTSLQNAKKTFDDPRNMIEMEVLKKPTNGQRGYIRIEVPERKPEIRTYDLATIEMIYSGNDAGHCIFKKADAAYALRKAQNMDLFVNGKFVAPKKANYKLEDEEVYCQFCGFNVTKMAEHEKTDQHRNKVRHQGIVSELERVIMTTRLAIENLNKNPRKRRSDESENDLITAKEIAEYEYGENETKIIWRKFRRRGEALIVDEGKEILKETESNQQSLPETTPILKPILLDPRSQLLQFCGFPVPPN